MLNNIHIYILDARHAFRSACTLLKFKFSTLYIRSTELILKMSVFSKCICVCSSVKQFKFEFEFEFKLLIFSVFWVDEKCQWGNFLGWKMRQKLFFYKVKYNNSSLRIKITIIPFQRSIDSQSIFKWKIKNCILKFNDIMLENPEGIIELHCETCIIPTIIINKMMLLLLFISFGRCKSKKKKWCTDTNT